MRRINFHVDEELDAALAAEAARCGESNAALLRRAARAWLDEQRVADRDPGAVFTGAVTGPAGDDQPDDDVIYRG